MLTLFASRGKKCWKQCSALVGFTRRFRCLPCCWWMRSLYLQRQMVMCVAAFFWCQKTHRSVTTKILSPGIFVRCDTRKQTKLNNVGGHRFCATTRKKKGPRSTMALDRRWFFQVTAELQRMPSNNCAFVAHSTAGEHDFHATIRDDNSNHSTLNTQELAL